MDGEPGTTTPGVVGAWPGKGFLPSLHFSFMASHVGEKDMPAAGPGGIGHIYVRGQSGGCGTVLLGVVVPIPVPGTDKAGGGVFFFGFLGLGVILVRSDTH